MKLLHLGKKGNVEKYSPRDDFAADMELVDLVMQTPAEEVLAAARDADFILADAMGAVPASLIEGMPNLKLIQSEGVGFQLFDIEAAAARGVYVCNGRGINASAVAEQALLLMLGLLRDVRGGDEAVRTGRQITVKEDYMVSGNLRELGDLTVGLYGFGAIARALARILAVMGVNVCYYKPNRASEEIEAQYGVTWLPLDELLASSDMVSLHIPLNAETRNIVNDDFFARMKEGSYLINTARGGLVDSEALVRALESGRLAGAGLDTIAGEPVQTDNVLVNQPEEISSRILFSPHIGGITASSFQRGYDIAWKNMKLIASGEKPVNIVNGL